MKSTFLKYLLCLCLPMSLWAQPIRQSSTIQMVDVAETQLLRGNYLVALEWFEKAYEKEKDIFTAYKIAETNFKLRDYKEANRWYERVFKQKNLSENISKGRFDYARSLKMVGKFQDASKEFRKFSQENEDRNLAKLVRAEVEGIKLAAGPSNDPKVRISEASEGLNKLSTESSPVFRGDKEVYFTALVEDGDDLAFAKIYSAKWSEEGWSKATPLSAMINSENEHQGNVAFSNDGQTMFFTRGELDGNLLYKSEIYYSKYQNETWSKPKFIDAINGDYIVKHPAFGQYKGKEGLFFVSNKKDALGGFDIYFSKLNSDGSYSSPLNLGEPINTVGDEQSPFYDNGKLYFSSNGHMSMGGFDIFESNWRERSKKWSKPHNIGMPYNSAQDDLFYNKNKEGSRGWLVSNRPSERSLRSSTCCDNIYEIGFEMEKVPPPPPPPVKVDVVFTLLNELNNQALKGAQAKLILKQGKEENGNVIGQFTNDQNNTYNFILKPNEIYEARFNLNGYEQESFLFNTRDIAESRTLRYNISMRPKKIVPPPPKEEVVYINQAIRLNSIYYDYNDDKILPEAERDLFELLDLLNRYPDMVIELSSNTDSRGGAPYNLALSQRRANSAKAWLMAKGIADSRINAVGKGESNLLNQCADGVECSEDEHRINRRTEFKIIDGPTSIKIRKRK